MCFSCRGSPHNAPLPKLETLDLSGHRVDEADAALLAHVLSQVGRVDAPPRVGRVKLWTYGLWLPVQRLRGYRTVSATIDLGLPGKKGYLMKESMHLRWWRRRWFTLDPVERVLTVHTDEQCSSSGLKLRIPLADVLGCSRKPDLHPSTLGFVVKTRLEGLETIHLCATNPMEMEAWLEVIHVNISNNRLQMIDATFIGCMLRWNTTCSYLKLHAVTLPIQITWQQ